MRRLYFVVCPACSIQFEVREVRPYRVAVGLNGDDEVTFNCPRCHRKNMTSPVRANEVTHAADSS
jgi:hypothetical protein